MFHTANKRNTSSTAYKDRIISAFRASLRVVADIGDLSREMSVCRSTARKYARMLADADMVVLSEERSVKGTPLIKIVPKRYIYFAILRLERDILKLTLFSFFPRDIRVIYLTYNESLMPEDNAQTIIHLLRNTCDTMGAERIFLGVIKYDGSQIDDAVCASLCADKILSPAECELLTQRKEKERALTVAEYFFNSTRKARINDMDSELWQSIDSAERGMTDALLIKIAEDTYRSSLGRP